MGNILEEVQIEVQDRLNADSQLSGLCQFVAENKRDIDYEIKAALGKQGVVGLVMTPRATFAGAYEDHSLVWQIDELEIDIVENVTVNRGKGDGYVTGQDAAMRLFDVLCPLSGDNEGQFVPVSYEEGEDGSLLVNKCVLKCLVHSVPLQDTTTKVKYAWSQSWDSFPLSGTLNHDDLPSREGIHYVRIGSSIDEIGYAAFQGMEFLMGVEIPDTVTTIGGMAFAGAEGMTNIEIPSSVSSIGSKAFFGCHLLSNVTLYGKTLEEVEAMDNYPWGLPAGSTIHCTDGDIVVGSTSVVYQNGQEQEISIVGELTRNSIPNNYTLVSVNVGRAVTSIGIDAFDNCTNLSSVTIPGSVTTIGNGAFLGCSSLANLVINEGVETIEGGAFWECRSIASITIPNSVTSIGDDVFFNCEALNNVTFSGKDMQTVQGMERYSWGLKSGCTIHCTDGNITV